ncbi:uncharacterized protein Z518_05660 [Rhinocladiella mackenziei CBS 650.93]|uniref:Uncharacterized protein n=1 Tax=Rhinocladiella mackenziei CBS 650.93 TaxID=1442369 RepID=A0A0D2IG70_9EURO|nr:uncharacterized protein Z518_05660 [Rhinocladiella mackenziei CBS 650.93]KIX04789.1 hypothetical protein Z518_05660 [Rhinocladiella mackenziei CBS 650.93]
MSRKDIPWNPITGSDMILRWSVFPREKPVSTFPVSAYAEKPNPFAFACKTKRDVTSVTSTHLNAHIACVLEHGFGWSASSCLVLLVFALAAVWGHYPDDERRPVASVERRDSYPGRYVTLAVPEHRMEEVSYLLCDGPEKDVGGVFGRFIARRGVFLPIWVRIIRKAPIEPRILAKWENKSMWHQYNIEPIQGWKMFRTASMLWETYNPKHAHGKAPRSKQEESISTLFSLLGDLADREEICVGLEQRLYWTCPKSECEVRHELTDLPSCTLQESSFPFSPPTFPTVQSFEQSTADIIRQEASSIPSTPSSYYYYLAEISLRRLLNRTRNAATLLSPTIDSFTTTRLDDTLQKFEHQLQQ